MSAYLDGNILGGLFGVNPSADVACAFLETQHSLLKPFLHFRYLIVDGQLFTVDVKQPRVILDQLKHNVSFGIGVTKKIYRFKQSLEAAAINLPKIRCVITSAFHRHQSRAPQSGKVANRHEILFAFVLDGVQMTEHFA